VGGTGLSVFVDASALVAMIEDEPDSGDLADRLGAEPVRLWSALACWETVSSLQSSYGRPVTVARQVATDFAGDFGLRLVPVGGEELTVALDAYGTYGKGRHPAALNFGDCFAYACAKTNGARLLYKGDDFARTDLG
jgi:ribonuclease VapC